MTAIGQVNYVLKAKILEKAHSASNLCRKLGWSEHRLSKIICGRVRPRDDERQVLSQELGVSEQDLFPS